MPSGLPELAADVVRAKASVIVACGGPAVGARPQRATSTIPIVANGDPSATGLSPACRPGGNTTGVSMLDTELNGKRLEMLKEIVPRDDVSSC